MVWNKRVFIGGAVLASVASAADDSRKLQLPIDVTKCDDEDTFGEIITYSKMNPMPFCANYGVCKLDYVIHPEQPCDCPEGYGGPHCEYMDDEVPECVLGCENDGVCMVGATSWDQIYEKDFMLQDAAEHQYCLCREGFHGTLCQYEAEPCGANQYCYNGGSCVILQKMDGTTSFNCDCTTAGQDHTAYAGEFCEYEASSYCDHGMDQNGRHFCVNGGTCQDESRKGCDCDEGFVGPLCEFRDMGFEFPECSLTCENHGICRRGAKDLSVLKEFGIHHRYLEAYDNNFEHCVCPAGFAGLQCEYKVDVCPGGEHLCLNGGDCQAHMDGDHVFFQCDCSSAKTANSRFAGDYCEMESTEFCTLDRERTSRGDGQDSFCTNRGVCLDLVEHGETHPGCECMEGFYGEHCEYEVPSKPSPSHNKGGFIALLTILCLVIVIGFVVIYYYIMIADRSCLQLSVMDRNSAPTMDSHLKSVVPWCKDVHRDEAEMDDIPLEDDEDEDTNQSQSFSVTRDETRIGYSDNTEEVVDFVSGTECLTENMDRGAEDGFEFDGVGSVASGDLLSVPSFSLKIANPSIGSSNSDHLHVFNDSNDGSEHMII